MSLSTCGRVQSFAFYSRILLLILQMFFNFLIPDHDAGVFDPPIHHRKKMLDFVLGPLVSGLRKWDGLYFVHIAEHGYSYENTLAFFPLFPLCIRLFANTFLYPLTFFASYTNVLTLAACMINVILFVESAKTLYELSLYVVKDKRIAFKATLLFCINPASIFFTAAYSETMFAFLTFKGLLCVQRKQHAVTAFWFGLSCLTRSNGFINAGFMIYASVKEIQRLTTCCVHPQPQGIGISNWVRCLKVAARMVLQVAVCCCSFIWYQFYAYTLYCDKSATSKDFSPHVLKYGGDKHYKMPHTGPSEWCKDSVPLSYSYVQSKHWDVGFLKYYELKQFPNFLLAAPMVLICVSSILYYMRNNFMYCMTLGLYDSITLSHKKTDNQIVTRASGYLGADMYVYIVHLLFLVNFSVLMMHVQVTTRFIASSSPVIYWYIATVTTPTETLHDVTEQNHGVESGRGERLANDTNVPDMKYDTTQNGNCDSRVDSAFNDLDELYELESSSIIYKCIFVYFHLYFFVGAAAFPNFLPWT